MNAVYADWAEDLEPFTIGAIKWAIDSTRRGKMPPNIGEFIDACKNYIPPQSDVLQIGKKLSPEQKQRNHDRLMKAAAELGMKLKA